jgi:predicted DNA-binding transcriptional regulator AlpA
MEETMLTETHCRVNNRVQKILREQEHELLSAVELAQYLDPSPLKDSPSRPGLPLRKLLRDQKIIGAQQGANGRWCIHKVSVYKEICSVEEVRMICGYSNPKSIYDRVYSKTIPFQSTTGDNLKGVYFIREEIEEWQRNKKAGKPPVMSVDAPVKSISTNGHRDERLAKLRDALPTELHDDFDELLIPQRTPESKTTFKIPEYGNQITDADIRKQSVRITRGLKQYFLRGDQQLDIEVDGQIHSVRFQDRELGDRPRSHVLHLGHALVSNLNLDSNPSIDVIRVSDKHFIFQPGTGSVHQKISVGTPVQSQEQDVSNAPSPESISQDQFQLVGSLGDLLLQGLPNMDVLGYCGVYQIKILDTYRPVYIEPDSARETGNVVNPWSIERLVEKWVDGIDTVYIGLAGARSRRTLKRRLTDLIRHGRGQTTDRGPHKGGEILWQLEGYERFTLWVLPTGDPPKPRKQERQYLADFVRKHGKLPFANRQF